MIDTCVCCGETIPEGRMVCSTCESKSHDVLSFDKTKKLLKEAIDEGKTLLEIMEIFTNKVYEQGKRDSNNNGL